MKINILILGFLFLASVLLTCCRDEPPLTAPGSEQAEWYLYTDNDCTSCIQQTWVDGIKVRDISSGVGEQYLGKYFGAHLIEIKKNCGGEVTTVCSETVSAPHGYYVEADLKKDCTSCEIVWSPDRPT